MELFMYLILLSSQLAGKTLEELVESGDKDATKLKDYIKMDISTNLM